MEKIARTMAEFITGITGKAISPVLIMHEKVKPIYMTVHEKVIKPIFWVIKQILKGIWFIWGYPEALFATVGGLVWLITILIKLDWSTGSPANAIPVVGGWIVIMAIGLGVAIMLHEEDT